MIEVYEPNQVYPRASFLYKQLLSGQEEIIDVDWGDCSFLLTIDGNPKLRFENAVLGKYSFFKL